MTTDAPISEQIATLAERSAARQADLDCREERLKKAEQDIATRRAEIETETKALAERLALVNEAEADLQRRISEAAAPFTTLQKARAAADATYADYEARMSKLREILARRS